MTPGESDTRDERVATPDTDGESRQESKRRALPSEAGHPLVIAHRGASGYRPENTMVAYELAVTQRADMIEIDLHVSQDGGIPISHDAELARIGGQGEIADHSLEVVQSLDAGDGQRVPTLDEVLDRFGSRIPFNLEMKQSTRGPYEGLPAAALEAVRERGLLPDTLFSSFYRGVLRDLRKLSEEVRCALLLSPQWPDEPIERALALGAEAINPHFVMAEPGLIDRAHAAGLAVYVYTVDDEAKMEELLDAGADGLFTNRPDRMRALLARRTGAMTPGR